MYILRPICGLDIILINKDKQQTTYELLLAQFAP